jgi:hypothetical protein
MKGTTKRSIVRCIPSFWQFPYSDISIVRLKNFLTMPLQLVSFRPCHDYFGIVDVEGPVCQKSYFEAIADLKIPAETSPGDRKNWSCT